MPMSQPAESQETETKRNSSDCSHGGGCCDECGPIKINAHVDGQTRMVTHEGREKMIVPVIAIVEGVLNNALVEAEEFGRYVSAWEGRPVPVGHPQLNGIHVSANLPQVLEARNIGHFHNAHVDGDKLKGELWIDVQSATGKGFGEIVEAFRNNEMMEVSTAYFADEVRANGVRNGREYNVIHRNLRPDHLAVLPGEVGACSIEDGCGAMRTHQEKGVISNMIEKLRGLFGMPALGLKANEEGLTERMRAVSNAIDDMDQPSRVFYMVEVFDDFAVYESEGRMYKRPYAVREDGSAEFTGPAEEVRMQKDYVPIGQQGGAEQPQEEPSANSNGETEVEAMTDEVKAPELDADTLTAVNWAKTRYKDHRNCLISGLTANSKCQFSEDELKAMSVETLEKLDASLAPAKPDYSGRGMPVTHSQDDEVEALQAAPPVVMRKQEAH